MPDCLALMAEASSSPLLDPPMRAVLLMSLLAFVILGLGLVVGVLLGGRWARRYGGDQLHKPLPLRKPAEGEQREPAMLRNAHWGGVDETTSIDGCAAETQAG